MVVESGVVNEIMGKARKLNLNRKDTYTLSFGSSVIIPQL